MKYKDNELKNFINDSSEYIINLDDLSCTCKDWTIERYNYPKNDPRRLCKHIIKKLDLNNLNNCISKFKESISFYQEKGWGFKKNFDEVLEIENFTLLSNFDLIDWIDVFDENNTKYAIIKDDYSDSIYWAKNLKPKKYEIIEKYILNEAEKIPLYLQEEEYPLIIDFIKKVLPHKKDLFIDIDLGQSVPTKDGIIYDVFESKLSPEEEKALELKLINKYDDIGLVYEKLDEATAIPMNDLENDEYDIHEALRVKNHEVILRMYGNNQYVFKRDYEFAKKIVEKKELEKKLRNEREQEEAAKYAAKYAEYREKRKEDAQKKGYILVSDYNGNLYDINDKFDYNNDLLWDEYWDKQNAVKRRYVRLSRLIANSSLKTTSANFNKVLKRLNFIKKDSSLNNNDWIFYGEGLKYGINLIKDSQYMHEKVPKWYKAQIFDNTKMELVTLESNTYIKMTSALFDRNKFDELCELYKQEIEKNANKRKVEGKINLELEREKWLKHVNCPNCGEKRNIHKKDKRKRLEYTVQRFYCNECKSMFQIKTDELEKMIEENNN